VRASLSWLDAALLFPAIRGALPPDDARTVATLAAVGADLTEDRAACGTPGLYTGSPTRDP
jgi:hypothetical protein